MLFKDFCLRIFEKIESQIMGFDDFPIISRKQWGKYPNPMFFRFHLLKNPETEIRKKHNLPNLLLDKTFHEL